MTRPPTAYRQLDSEASALCPVTCYTYFLIDSQLNSNMNNVNIYSLARYMNAKLLTLKKSVVYGPVNSRRLGRSLGINVLPDGKKMCSFDCLYCQYGYSRISNDELAECSAYPDRVQIKNTVEKIIKDLEPKPQYLTFSGNGEATLHRRFPDLVVDLIDIRDQYSPESKTAILSNSTMVGNQHIRKALNRLDEKIMKLDAGTDEMLQLYNRPVGNIKLIDIVENLKLIPGVTIQSLFSDGKSGNTSPDHIEKWARKINEIRPKNVQIYTLDRGYPSRNILPASKSILIRIKSILDEFEIPSEVY